MQARAGCAAADRARSACLRRLCVFGRDLRSGALAPAPSCTNAGLFIQPSYELVYGIKLYLFDPAVIELLNGILLFCEGVRFLIVAPGRRVDCFGRHAESVQSPM